MEKTLPVERITSKIYLIRGQKVMLDRELAELYGVETGALNRAVKRNADRFPEDFMFQITEEEAEFLRCQFGISKSGRGGCRYLPYAFSEQVVAMLSSVLKSRRAIEVNIAIMRAFVHLRNMIASHDKLARKLAELEHQLENHDEQIKTIFEAIRQLVTAPEKSVKKIGYTVKEKQKPYSKSRPSKVLDGFFLTPQARRIWDTVTGDLQVKILNNVWCDSCSETTGIGNVSGKVEKGMLVLRGVCTRCGGEVARVIENE
jgi:hypothetical protein